MTDVTSAKTARRPHHWRRDLIELAALFTAVAVADVVANLIGHQPDGPYLLAASAVALTATATFHTWWARRYSHAPPPEGGDSVSGGTAVGYGAELGLNLSFEASPALDETVLWRMRTTVQDTPGSLAALCIALARLRIDILTLQTHPLADGTVDEFLLRAPSSLSASELTREVSAAGGRPPGSSGPTPTIWWTPRRGFWGWPRVPRWTRRNFRSPSVSCWAAAPSTRCRRSP